MRLIIIENVIKSANDNSGKYSVKKLRSSYLNTHIMYVKISEEAKYRY